MWNGVHRDGREGLLDRIKEKESKTIKKSILTGGGTLALICWGWSWPPLQLGLGGHHR